MEYVIKHSITSNIIINYNIFPSTKIYNNGDKKVGFFKVC